MATANAMFDRFTGSYRRLFAPEATPRLALVHGKRALNAGFSDVGQFRYTTDVPAESFCKSLRG
jgi:hypothetical protein